MATYQAIYNNITTKMGNKDDITKSYKNILLI